MGLVIDVSPWSIYLKPTQTLPRVSLKGQIPGMKVNSMGWGRLPLSPFLAEQVLEKFGNVATKISPELFHLASAVKKIPECRKVCQDANLPDPPSKTAWWPHQKEAFYFFLGLYNAGFRGVGLFSELGTGKSKVAVGLVDHFKAEKVLCLGPRSSLLVWYQEFKKHSIREYQIVLPDMSQSVRERLRRIQVRMKYASLPVIIIMNYEAIWRPPLGQWALEQEWDFVIADELHRIKTHNGKISLFMAQLRDCAKHRIGLTGTPLHHKPLDIWAQYRFLDPGVYGLVYWDFERKYSSLKGYKRNYKNEEEFAQKLYSIAYRASGDVIKLPEAVREDRYGSLNKESLAIYKDIERKIITQIKNGEITIHNALVRLIRLQQLTSGFIRDDDGNLQVIGHEKEELFDDFLNDFPQDEPLIVFCEFHYDLDRVKEVVEKHGLKYAEFSGRKDELKLWQDGKRDILAVQIRTGAQSVDLTRARYAVYYSFGLSLGDYQQSLKRIHRVGQNRSVVYVHLLMQYTIDERKMKYFEQRSDVIQGLLEEYGSLSE